MHRGAATGGPVHTVSDGRVSVLVTAVWTALPHSCVDGFDGFVRTAVRTAMIDGE